MNRKFKTKEAFHGLVGLATIVSCVFTIIGVMKVITLVVEVQPVMKEIYRQQDTILKLRRDTIKLLVHDTITIVRRDTVRVYHPQPNPDKASDPWDRAGQAEDDFRRRHPEIFN